MPLARAHGEIAHRRLLLDAVFDILYPAVKKADHHVGQIELGRRPKVDIAHLSLTQPGMVPGADHQLGLLARQVRAPVFLHQSQMRHRAIAVIVPAAEIQVGHRDLLMYLGEFPRLSRRLLKPILSVVRQPLRQMAHHFHPRHQPQPAPVLDLVPDFARFLGRMRRRRALPPPQIGRH